MLNNLSRVQLAGQSETVVGDVDFINAVSAGDLTKARAEALLPAVPAKLVNRSLSSRTCQSSTD